MTALSLAVLLVVLSILGSSSGTPPDCIRTFQEFAFGGPTNVFEGYVYPGPPWDRISEMPLTVGDEPETEVGFTRLAAIRQVDGDTELWITGWRRLDYERSSRVIAVYSTQTNTWRSVTSAINDTTGYVTAVFSTPDDKVWGIVGVSPRDSGVYPVLVQYDDLENRFEIVASHVVQNITSATRRPQASAASDGRIWLLVPTSPDVYEIYFVGQESGESSLVATFRLPREEGGIYQVQSTPAGVYFAHISHAGSPNRASTKLYRVSFDDFSIHEIPTMRSLGSSSGFLVDSVGQLWLDPLAVGDGDGNWSLIDPPSEYVNVVESKEFTSYWLLPRPAYETSDGLLWFVRFLDTAGEAEGIAWYDPKTDQGCMVTNYPATLAEDKSGQVWILVENTLYRRASGI